MSISERLPLPSVPVSLPVLGSQPNLLPTGTITTSTPITTITTSTASSSESLSISSPFTSSSATSTSSSTFSPSSSSPSSSDPGTSSRSRASTTTTATATTTSTTTADSVLPSSPSASFTSTSTSTSTSTFTSTSSSNSNIHASRPGWIPYTTSMSYTTVTSTLADGELTTYTSAVPTALFSPPPSPHSSGKAALAAGLTAVGVLAFFVALGVLWAWRRRRVRRNESEVVEREEKKWGLVPGSSNIRKGGGGASEGKGSIGSGKESRRLLEDEDFDDEPTPMQTHRSRTINERMASVELLPVTQVATPTAAQRQAQGGTTSSRTSSAHTHHSSAYRDPFTRVNSANSAS